MSAQLAQTPSETGSETPLEVKQQVFSLISRIVGKLDYLEQEGCPALASILKASMLQITPYEKAERDLDGNPVPRWDHANESDLRTLRGIDNSLEMAYVNPRELRQMIIGIIQTHKILETELEKDHPEDAIKVHKAENLARPDAPAVNVLQSYYDQLIYALYELERLSDNKTTGTLIQ